jgi:hypothetical protein
MAPSARRYRGHQAAFRASVTIRLGAGFGNLAKWSLSGGMPFLTNLPDLTAAPPFAGVDTTAILLNRSEPTVLEQAKGHWTPAIGSIAQTAPPSVRGLIDAFNQHVWPSRSMPSTRSKHWDNWAVVVTWAIAWGLLLHILPMPTDILKAITWELLCMGTPRSVITAIWASIQNRHRVAGLHPPIYGFGEFSAWTRCLSSLLGRPSALRFPIHRSLVALLLRLRPASLRDNRDRLMVALATIAASASPNSRPCRSAMSGSTFTPATGSPALKAPPLSTSTGARMTSSVRVTTRPSAGPLTLPSTSSTSCSAGSS